MCSRTFHSGDQTNVRSWGKSGRHLLVLSVSQFDPEQKSEIKIVRISDTGTSLESGVRRLEPLRARHYAVQAIGRGHIVNWVDTAYVSW
jgi:hypothetical protein